MRLASLSNKKILVTGASGFTGFHLVNVLKSMECYVLCLNAHKNNQSTCNSVVADITDLSQLTEIMKDFQPDFVIHLAAISFVGHENVSDFYNVNVIGTENILSSIIAAEISKPKVLIASSANVYGSLESTNISEKDECRPVNHYAISKLAMEKIVMTYFDKLEIIITRPFNYTGIKQTEKFLVPKIVKHFKERKKVIELGNLDVSRDYSSVAFIVDSYIKLLESDFHSDIVNVCSSSLISLKEIISRMNKIAGYDIEVIVNPAFVRTNEIKQISGSNSKLFNIIENISDEKFDDVLISMFSYKG